MYPMQTPGLVGCFQLLRLFSLWEGAWCDPCFGLPVAVDQSCCSLHPASCLGVVLCLNFDCHLYLVR